jgi:hypothetical protein
LYRPRLIFSATVARERLEGEKQQVVEALNREKCEFSQTT